MGLHGAGSFEFNPKPLPSFGVVIFEIRSPMAQED